MLRDLLVAGLGIGALPSFLADPAIADGRLARVLPDLPAAPRHVYAVYPTSRHLQGQGLRGLPGRASARHPVRRFLTPSE